MDINFLNLLLKKKVCTEARQVKMIHGARGCCTVKF